MAVPTRNELCAIPTGASATERDSAIMTVASYMDIPPVEGAISDTNHPFALRTITNELHDGDPYGDGSGTSRLILRWYPIVSITGITDFSGTSYGYTENTDYVNEDSITNGRWSGTLRRYHGVWAIGQMNIKVSYTAGLTTSSNVPQALSEAIRLVTLEILNNPTRLKSVSVDGVAYTFGEEYISMTARQHLAPFMKYKRL